MSIEPPLTRAEPRSWLPNEHIDLANDKEVIAWAARLCLTPGELREIIEELGDRTTHVAPRPTSLCQRWASRIATVQPPWDPQNERGIRATVAKILLIVEDQVLLAMGLRDELADSGYRILELAIRHQEALGFAREVRPDLALVNINLAQGDDGLALARDLKALGVPVLFISGQQDRARLARDVAIASLSKPYSSADMVDAVDYLFRHERADESVPPPSRLEVFDGVSPT